MTDLLGFVCLWALIIRGIGAGETSVLRWQVA